MKKLGVNLLKFSMLLVVVYVIGLFMFNSFLSQRYRPNLITKLGHNNIRLQEVKQCNGLDILFLGSSHAYRGFDTRKFADKGYSVFNLGSSAQTPLQTNVLIERYLKNTNPELIVFEVYPVLFTNEGVEASIDLINNDNNDFNSLKLLFLQKNVKVLNSFLYRSIQDVIFNKINLEALPLGKEYHYHKGGYISRDMSYYHYENFDNEILQLREDQLKAFNRILKTLNQKSISYILVQAPITTAKYNSILNNDSFDSLMQSKGEYYNFNKIIKLDDSLHFFDSHHLNQDGVDEFNKKFIELVLDDEN